MSEVRPEPRQSIPKAQYKNENDSWSKIVIALMFLFVSFFCIFCASQSALWFIDRSQVGASTISENRADYSQGPRIAVQPVDAEALAAEKARDDEALASEEEPLISGILVPVPIPARPTPEPPTPIPPIALAPTPTPTTMPTSLPASTETPLPAPAPLPATVPPTVLPPTVGPTQTPQVSTPTSAPVTPTPGQGTPTPQPATPTPQPATLTLQPATPTPNPPTPTPESPATSTPLPIPRVNFSDVAYTVNENGSTAIITVLLSNTYDQTVTVNYTSADGTATAGSDYISVAGTLSFIPGQTSNVITIPIANDMLDEASSETVLLTLSNPSKAMLGSIFSATLSIIDDDNPPTVQFSDPTYSVDESLSFATISVTLSAKSSLTVTAIYGSSAGTATAGKDYNNVSGIITFAPNQPLQTFTVPILTDSIDEPSETVNLALSAPGNATLGTPNTAVLTIVDDDSPPDVRFDQPAYTTIEDSGPATITTTLSISSGFTITVNYTTSDITAIAGSDYLTQTGVLTFTVGQTLQTFTIPITADTENEFDETLAITLSNPNNAALGTPSGAVLTIENDDSSTVRFANATYSVVENVAFGVIDVVLTPTSPITVTIDYATFGLTASPGSDYLTATGTLTFTPGQTNASFNVPIQPDAFQEPDETVLLKLSNPNGALLGLATATLTITDDGDSSTCTNEAIPTIIGEPNIGPANGTYREVRCNSAIIVDVSATPIDTSTSDAAFDFVYYELGQPDPPTNTTHILLDWVVIEVAPDITGPWYQVFYWGDTITDTNTNVGQAGFGPGSSATPPLEEDNEVVPVGSLYGTLPYITGIAIDVDATAPPNIYRYLRFYVPDGGANDTAQVDAIEILP